MKLIKNIRKTKVGMRFLIGGCIFAILFLFLLTINHLNILRTHNILKNFDKTNQYEMIVTTTKTETKQKLFDYENLHFYGYGIRNIQISLDGNKMNLKTIINENDYTLEDFLNNFSLITETEDKTIQKYKKGNLYVTIENLHSSETDVIFSEVSKTM